MDWSRVRAGLEVAARAVEQLGEHSPQPGANGTGRSQAPNAFGVYVWGRPVLTWEDAEMMAAAHLTHIGFGGVTRTPGTGDAGLDVIGSGVAAQVKFQQKPTGRPALQSLAGAASGVPTRVFYAKSYASTSLVEADRLGLALFQYNDDGAVVAANSIARGIAPTQRTATRTVLGALTFESRQARVFDCAQQIEAATQTSISNRQRHAAKQLQRRETALRMMLRALSDLEATNDPRFKSARRKAALERVEKSMREAAKVLGLRLR